MTLLHCLPYEIQSTIFADLSRKDIVALSRTSRALRDVVIPSLYRSIGLTCNRNIRRPTRCITLLARTLLENPEGAANVKTISLNAVKYGPSEYVSRTHDPFTDVESVLVKTAIEKSGIPKGERWHNALLEERDLSALVAFLIALLPNLEDLSIYNDFVPPNSDWLCELVEHAIEHTSNASSRPLLQKLANITIHSNHWSRRQEHPTPLLYLLMYLPNLVKIDIWFASDASAELGLPYLQSHSRRLLSPTIARNLETLRLEYLTATTNTVEMLLLQTVKLKELKYHCSLTIEQRPLLLQPLSQALDHVRRTLTRLCIKYDLDDDDLSDGGSFDNLILGTLGTLRSLKSLTYLEISIFVLFGELSPSEAPSLAEVLPPRLEELTFNDDLWDYGVFSRWTDENILSVFREFFTANETTQAPWKTATPQLEECKFVWKDRHHEFLDKWGERRLNRLRDMCLEEGLRSYVVEQY